jgi:hypothetical protein
MEGVYSLKQYDGERCNMFFLPIYSINSFKKNSHKSLLYFGDGVIA